MVNIWRCAHSMVAIILIAGLCCSKPKDTGTASTATPLAPEDSAATAPTSSAQAPMATRDAGPGPDEWYTCKKPEECTLVYENECCLPDCDPLSFAGYVAVNAKHRADFVGHIGCADAKCARCPTPMPDVPRSDANFFALCQQGRCTAVDLRYSKYNECKTVKDCALRFGLGCCEACGDKDL